MWMCNKRGQARPPAKPGALTVKSGFFGKTGAAHQTENSHLTINVKYTILKM